MTEVHLHLENIATEDDILQYAEALGMNPESTESGIGMAFEYITPGQH